MAEQNLRVRLGGFLVVVVLAFTVLIVLFGGTPEIFADQAKYVLIYPEAPGVNSGTPIRKSGVRIGQVTGIDIDEDTGKVRVSIVVENKYLPRQNEEAVISRGLLSGDTTIDFVPKANETGQLLVRMSAYPPNTDIQGVPPLNTRVLLNQAGSAIPNAQDALAKFTSTVQKFEGVGPKAEKALDEITAFVKAAREMVPEIQETNRRLQDFIGRAELPGENPEGPVNLKTLIREFQDFAKEYKPLAGDLRKLVADNQENITKAITSLKMLTENANGLLTEENKQNIAKLLETINQAAGDLLSEQNKTNVAEILKNIKEGSDDLTKTIRLVGILADRADVTVKELNARIAQAKSVFDNIEKATKPIAENAEPVMKNIANAADALAKTLTEAKQTITMINNSEGTLNQFLKNPQLYNQFVETTASLNRTLIRAEKIAKDLEVFADKVARKPETIGLGGVVRPSTGLKEAPSAPVAPNTPYPGPRNPGAITPIAPVPFGTGGQSPLPPISSFRFPNESEGNRLPPQPVGPRLTPTPVVRPPWVMIPRGVNDE